MAIRFRRCLFTKLCLSLFLYNVKSDFFRYLILFTVQFMMELTYFSDYLLWWLNLHHRFEYVEYMKLSQPEDDCKIMLAKVRFNYICSHSDD